MSSMWIERETSKELRAIAGSFACFLLHQGGDIALSEVFIQDSAGSIRPVKSINNYVPFLPRPLFSRKSKKAEEKVLMC